MTGSGLKFGKTVKFRNVSPKFHIIVRELMLCTEAKHDEVFFWGVHAGAELDMLLLQNGRRLGFEIKLTK